MCICERVCVCARGCVGQTGRQIQKEEWRLSRTTRTCPGKHARPETGEPWQQKFWWNWTLLLGQGLQVCRVIGNFCTRPGQPLFRCHVRQEIAGSFVLRLMAPWTMSKPALHATTTENKHEHDPWPPGQGDDGTCKRESCENLRVSRKKIKLLKSNCV